MPKKKQRKPWSGAGAGASHAQSRKANGASPWRIARRSRKAQRLLDKALEGAKT